MKRNLFIVMMTAILSTMGTHHAFAYYNIAVENADSVIIYYNYSADGTELIVTSGENKYSGNVVIPEEVTYMNRTRKVTSIGSGAFSECSLTSVTIPNSVTSIGDEAFYWCGGLTSVTIPNSVTSIGSSAFRECSGLTSVTIGNSVTSIGNRAFCLCSSLTSVTIPNSVTSIGDEAFYWCKGLTSVTIGNSVTSIGDRAFENCHNLTSVTIPNSVTTIGNRAFNWCYGLTSVTIPNSVTSIGDGAFYCKNLTEVVSQIEEPFSIAGKNYDSRTFTLDVFNNVTLYVPVGTIEKYKATDGWKDFLFIEEGTGSGGGTTPEPEQCAKPTISYSNGELTFSCATEGAKCVSTITDADIRTYTSSKVQLGVTYHVSVYATKAGYNNSETATATLCWIDVEPTITFGTGATALGSIEARPVLIQTNGQVVSISGAPEGSAIAIYDVAGQLVGSGKATAGTTDISTQLCNGDIVIVKIGSKAVKVVVK